MSNHQAALVPLGTGLFQSPGLLAKGRRADTGIFAEALLYYDTVYVHVDNPEQFAAFIGLLIQQGMSFRNLNRLVKDGVLRFVRTTWVMPFMGTGHPDIITSLYQIQESGCEESDYFFKRFVEFENVKNAFYSSIGTLDSKALEEFRRSAKESAIVLSSNEVDDGVITNAYDDCLNPDRYALIARALYQELYKVGGLGKLPRLQATIRELNSSNIDEIARAGSTILGREKDSGVVSVYELALSPHIDAIPSPENSENRSTFPHVPVVLAGVSNLYINAAARLGADLFLPEPISRVVGNKLYEITEVEIARPNKISNIIEGLEAKVEFPDLQKMVNEDRVDFEKVLEIRDKAQKFRTWLQSESDRDRDAIIAYHTETAKAAGFAGISKRALKIFGVISSLGVSLGVEAALGSDHLVAKEIAKNAGVKLVESVFNYGSNKIGQDWKPVCFGNWYKAEIQRVLDAETN